MPQPSASASAPVISVYHRASEDLDFIRKTMERAAAFTAVPGKGLIANGVLGFAGAALAERATSDVERLQIWLICAAIGFVVGVVAMTLKANRAGVSLLAGPGRRFLVALLPPFVAAAVLSFALVRAGDFGLLPGCWILLYGVGVLTGGAFAIRPVVLMGGCFFALGVVTILLPASHANACMAVGFGFLQVVFGALIARRYGG